MSIGVIACSIMRRELEPMLAATKDIARTIWIKEAEHVNPEQLRTTVQEHLNSLKDEVDVIFLGYGRCNSLDGIEDEYDLPVVHPKMEDCIAILFTPERYQDEVRNEAGTWFMTPGWAKIGLEMIHKELHLERFIEAGHDPREIARELFANYTRGLFIDTGVGDNDHYRDLAGGFCKEFNLRLEQAVSRSTVLADSLAECVRLNRR